jgi:hypothetical protein
LLIGLKGALKAIKDKKSRSEMIFIKILDYEKFFLTNDKSCIKIDTSSREGFAPPTCHTRQGGQTMRPKGKERAIQC